MSLRRTVCLSLAATIAVCVVGLHAIPAQAVPSAQATAADRAALERAVEKYEAAQAQSADLDARVSEASAELDRIVAEEKACQERLRTRVGVMYRSGDADTLSLLFGASSIQDFASRLYLLERIARQDVENMRALKAARAQARQSAEALLGLQADQARALDALAAEVASAKTELAASEAALREYEARTAESRARAKSAAKNSPDQQRTGSGEWLTAVASHYGRNFTGRGASGEQIGPYSMIVAHRTLPFGTLIEFEYEGKRAVARVADRGPYTEGRTFDLGPGVVRVLDFSGVHKIRYRIITQ